MSNKEIAKRIVEIGNEISEQLDELLASVTEVEPGHAQGVVNQLFALAKQIDKAGRSKPSKRRKRP